MNAYMVKQPITKLCRFWTDALHRPVCTTLLVMGLVVPLFIGCSGDNDTTPAVSRKFLTAAMIAAGGYHTCALLNIGKVKCWGYNEVGALGLGDVSHRGDEPGEMGDSLPIVNLGTNLTVIALSAGGYHNCAVLDNGQVKCWGYNDLGQLGLGDTANRGDGLSEMGDALPAVDLGTGRMATAITAGERGHTCSLLDNGQVKCWGNNSAGQLGIGDTTSHGAAASEMGDALPAVSLGTGRTVTALSAGGGHTCTILDNGQIRCWGQNSEGELGLGDTANRGDGPGEMGDALPVVDLGTGRTATAVTAGFHQTCALLDNGQIKCWGINDYGQLGLGDTVNRGEGPGEMGDALPTVDLGTGRAAVAVVAATGNRFTCALLDNGQVKCWGINTAGELGLGDTTTRGSGSGEMGDALPAINLGASRTATAVSAGNADVCALLDNGRVKCWGANNFGLLGLGDTTIRGDEPGEMGDALPAVDLGTE